MLPYTTNQYNAITKRSILKSDARLIADWNMNRFVKITKVENPLTTDDDNTFPVSSVVQYMRPGAGIVKAFARSNSLSYPTVGRTSTTPVDSTTDRFSYGVSKDDKYKYWRSPSMSTSTLYTGLSGFYTVPDGQIQVTYDTAFKANKFVFGFENTYIAPKHITVAYHSGGAWTTQDISNPTLDADGRLVLYRQSSGVLSTTVTRDQPATIDGVRLYVNAIDSRNAYATVIEVAPHYEVELTDDIFNVTFESTMSESNTLLPLGVASSNQGTVELHNTDGRYDKNNSSSPYAGMLAKWIDFYFDLNVHEVESAANSAEWIPAFFAHSEEPTFTEQGVEFTVKDSSMYLQEVKPPGMIFTKKSIVEIIIRLCHSVGFEKIVYDLADLDPQDAYSIVDYYWTDPEKTVWDHFNELADVTQTAIFFDERGRLNIQTRSAAFDPNATPVWIFDGTDVSASDVTAQSRTAQEIGKLADIVDYTEESTRTPNALSVNYQVTEPGKIVRGYPTMLVGWEPEGDVVLRASRLQADVTGSSGSVQYVYLNPAEAALWPFEGMFQIDGEVISYKGKEYNYHSDTGTTMTKKIVYSVEEQQALDAINPGMAWQNTFTGKFEIPKDGRGAKSTVIAAHARAGASYLCRIRSGTGTVITANQYVTKNLTDGTMRLNLIPYSATAANTRLTSTVTTGVTPRIVGTSIYYPTSGYGWGAAGLVVGLGTNNSGIYVELAQTRTVGNRAAGNELTITWKASSGAETVYGKGAALPVVSGGTYELDVQVTTGASAHTVTAYVDGAPRLTVSIPKASSTNTLPATAGPFIRNKTIADFGYLYMYGGFTGDTAYDAGTYLDVLRGSYVSQQHRMAQTLPSSQSKIPYPPPVRSGRVPLTSLFLDEFGTIVHEVRDFDVKFDNGPAVSSQIFSSNPKVAVSEFVPSPNGAKFTMVNISRRNEVANGEDTLTFGVDNSVDQKLMIYGRMVTRQDAKPATVEDAADITMYGRNELNIDSSWIQSEAAAKRIGQWIVDASEVGTIEMQNFANPFLQVLDKVAIQDSHRNRNWQSNQYFIAGKKMTYDGTPEVAFTLRRTV